MNFTAERFAELAPLTAPMDAPFQNLMFLLAAGPLPVACMLPVDGGDTDTPASDTEPTNPDGNTSAALTCESTSGSGSPESSDPSSGSASDGDSTGEPTLCREYADTIGACYGPGFGESAYWDCYVYLSAVGSPYGTACGVLIEDTLACLSQLTCTELSDVFEDLENPEIPCGVEWTDYREMGCVGWPPGVWPDP